MYHAVSLPTCQVNLHTIPAYLLSLLTDQLGLPSVETALKPGIEGAHQQASPSVPTCLLSMPHLLRGKHQASHCVTMYVLAWWQRRISVECL